MSNVHRHHNRITLLWYTTLLTSSNLFTAAILYIFYTDAQLSGLGFKSPAAFVHTCWLFFSCAGTSGSIVALVIANYQYTHRQRSCHPHPSHLNHHGSTDVELGLESKPHPPPKPSRNPLTYIPYRRQTYVAPTPPPVAPPPPPPVNKRLPNVPPHIPPSVVSSPAFHWLLGTGSTPTASIQPRSAPSWPSQPGADINAWLPNGARPVGMPDGDVQRPGDGRDESLEDEEVDGLGEGDDDSVGRITIMNDTGSQRSRSQSEEEDMEVYYAGGVV